jgi:hypothetical protein
VSLRITQLCRFHQAVALGIENAANAERTVSIRDSHTSSSKQDKFLDQFTFVVVMTAVETWKAPQAP